MAFLTWVADRAHGDTEVGGDLLVARSSPERGDDLPLACGQVVGASLRSRQGHQASGTDAWRERSSGRRFVPAPRSPLLRGVDRKPIEAHAKMLALVSL